MKEREREEIMEKRLECGVLEYTKHNSKGELLGTRDGTKERKRKRDS